MNAGGSMSASAVKEGAGGRTQVTNLAPVAQFAQRIGSADIIGEAHRFPTVDAAVRSLES